jgi:hypothetical protein
MGVMPASKLLKERRTAQVRERKKERKGGGGGERDKKISSPQRAREGGEKKPSAAGLTMPRFTLAIFPRCGDTFD